jgi:hypothetical protein
MKKAIAIIILVVVGLYFVIMHIQDTANNFETEVMDAGNSIYVFTNINTPQTDMSIEYKISGGAIRFTLAKNPYKKINLEMGSYTLAKAMYKAAKAVDSKSLAGRTIHGINIEIEIHWILAKLNFERARVVDIGGVDMDDNALVFEGIYIAMYVMSVWSIVTLMKRGRPKNK